MLVSPPEKCNTLLGPDWPEEQCSSAMLRMPTDPQRQAGSSQQSKDTVIYLAYGSQLRSQLNQKQTEATEPVTLYIVK